MLSSADWARTGWLAFFLLAAASGPLADAQAEVCPPGDTPSSLLSVARDPVSGGGLRPYPFVAMVLSSGISTTTYQHRAECGDLGLGLSGLTEATGGSSSETRADVDFDQGLIGVSQRGVIPAEDAMAGVNVATSISEVGFHDILEVSSPGTGTVDVEFSLHFGGTWSNPLCFQGVARRTPLHEVRLRIVDRPSPGVANVVADLPFYVAQMGLDPIDTGVAPLTVSANTRLYVDLYQYIATSAPTNTFVGEQFCQGGESIVDPGELRLRFFSSDPSVTVTPLSGITYSATVPEPEAMLGAASGVAALAALARRRRAGRAERPAAI